MTAYGQPTVAEGRVYVGSNDGTVYALDAVSGCIYWLYQAKAMVRDAVVIGPGRRAYVGDLESNFYALDADTGKLIWQRKLDDQDLGLHSHHRYGETIRGPALRSHCFTGRECRGESVLLLL